MQLRHTVHPDLLYQRFWYKSGINPQMVQALSDVVESAQARRPLRKGEIVIDIGCNDGTLLSMLPEGIRRVGYEPCLPLADQAKRLTGGEIYATYFDKPHPEKAAIIFSCAMFYDVENPRAFVQNIRDSLLPNGIWINQMNHLGAMVRSGALDNVCFEHLTYWDMMGFADLCRSCGLTLLSMEENQVNGGSLRTIMGHTQNQANVSYLKAWPRAPDVSRAALERWAKTVMERAGHLREFLSKHPGTLGYGASTRGMTILQTARVGPELLPATADRNPEKVGRLTCNGIPIISEEEMRERKPEYLLALPYHFIEGFVERERALLSNGTQFVLPDLTLRGIK